MDNMKDFVIIDDDIELGRGTKVWYFSHIQSGAKIGKDCTIGQNVNVGPNATIGNNVKIQNNVSVFEGVTIEDDVFVGPSVVFTNVMNPRAFVNRKSEFKSIVVKKGCSIGANATIVCGVTLGEYSMIGAGSVVTKSVPDYTVVYGNPARHKGYICECGVKIVNGLYVECEVCGSKYKDLGEDRGLQKID
jgi:UDP-2-acetamido-3-amino-2,3-dideoxy-glucuronate N-acetyltransferase